MIWHIKLNGGTFKDLLSQTLDTIRVKIVDAICLKTKSDLR